MRVASSLSLWRQSPSMSSRPLVFALMKLLFTATLFLL